MNLSGRSVIPALRFYKLEPSRPPGPLRRPEPAPGQDPASAKGGSDGGQKGLRDISAQLGTDEYARLRIGIGERGPIDAADFVLSRFRSAERPSDR